MEAYLFLTLLALAVVETTLCLTWRSVYFRVGIPIFLRSERASGSSLPPEADVVQQQMPECPYSDFVFRDLGNDTYAFRERMLGRGKRTYSAVMRGVLRFDRSRRLVSVTGYVNWFSLAFFVTITTVALTWLRWRPVISIMTLIAAGVLGGGIYVIQRRRFNEVAETAARLWGR